MVGTTFECGKNFRKRYEKLDYSFKIRLKKQIIKIVENPLCGKPMRNMRKGTREVRLKPYRISYDYNPKTNHVLFLDFYHKDKQ